MKRDMELVRAILLAIEGGKARFINGEPLEECDATPEAVTYHLRLLVQAELVEITDSNVDLNTYVRGLTWAGHDFLDTVRDPEIWRKTKAGAGRAGGMAFGLLKELATAYAKQKAKELTGFDL